MIFLTNRQTVHEYWFIEQKVVYARARSGTNNIEYISCFLESFMRHFREIEKQGTHKLNFSINCYNVHIPQPIISIYSGQYSSLPITKYVVTKQI